MKNRPSGVIGEIIGIFYGIVPLICLGCAWVLPIFLYIKLNLNVNAFFFIAFMILIPVSHIAFSFR